MKNLASIQKILWKKEIKGADNIELVGVLGWQVVTKKNQFQKDLVRGMIYKEILDKPRSLR